jgi:gamma-glutamyltranspeptidase/glutathione hydrolase
MNIQMALEAPRFTKKTWGGRDVQIEDRIPKEIRDALTAKGHQFKVQGDFSDEMGGGQAVIHDSSTGINWGASDPRKDGAAVPEPHPYFEK